ncbi:hypothetical protein B0A52_04089 [Exophiala mesophila]|uniref:Uncharacterized protein n=1 Tax=Exophiala mesophila TaxID=212818 RepID=A0A438NA95_EXOME|nr:hypothetical protein B0A52_04089 [Exophiala mesophila]
MDQAHDPVPTSLASLPSPLPEAPPGQVYTDEQWQTLFSILEVFVPDISTSHQDPAASIPPAQYDAARREVLRYAPPSSSPDLADAFLSEKLLSNPAFIAYVKRKFQIWVPPNDAKALGFILSSLNTKLGSLLMTGSKIPIHLQPLSARSLIVCKWSTARLAPLRAIYGSTSALARAAYTYSSSILISTIGYPDIPPQMERRPTYDFTFHDFTSSSTPTTLTTDVVIVGSGCGAGVTASHLARAGLRVLVLESAYHFPSTHFPMAAGEATENLYMNGGFFTSDDNTVGILAGSNFGGGGTVNWSASLQPQYAIRREWASAGLPHFTSPKFQDCLDTVCQRMGVPSLTDQESLAKIQHNFANQTLLEGARQAGMTVETVPQNTASRPHLCGRCTFGCPSTTKQGPANHWFPDAAAHGAQFIQGCFVDHVIFDRLKDSSKKTATGVQAIWTSRDRKTSRTLTINADRVIVAAGALNSPAVLQRSGLTNPHIGANLHLHPTASIWSVWKQRTNPWEGAILTVAATSLEDLDGYHHGPKIEVTCSVPGIGLLTHPWRASPTLDSSSSAAPLSAALAYKLNVAKFAHEMGFIVITRDQDTGRVYIDPSDPERRRIRVAYTPSTRDRANIWEGVLASLRIKYNMGAVEIDPGNPALDRFVRPSYANSTSPSPSESSEEETRRIDDAAFESWFRKLRDAAPSIHSSWMMGCAHQMGSCRMSSDHKSGVVDSRGRVWGTDRLYVADASTFPSASGVNPMVSTMGIAEWISRGIVKEIKVSKL